MQHAAELADRHCAGLERRCRRWRRVLAVRRCLLLALLLTLAVAIGNHVVDSVGCWSKGFLTARQNIDLLTQILLNA